MSAREQGAPFAGGRSACRASQESQVTTLPGAAAGIPRRARRVDQDHTMLDTMLDADEVPPPDTG